MLLIELYQLDLDKYSSADHKKLIDIISLHDYDR
jgi:hypothetical protein